MDLRLDLEAGYQWLRENHRKIAKIYGFAFMLILILAFFLVQHMVELSHQSVVQMRPELRIACWYIAGVFVVIWAFFQFIPHTLAAMFGLGVPAGLPNFSIGKIFKEGLGSLPDFKFGDIVKSGWDVIKTLVGLSAQIPYFVIVMAAVFGTWGIENDWFVWPILIALLGIFIGCALFFKTAFWYKTITMSVLVVSVGWMLYGTYVRFHPQDAILGKIEEVDSRQNDKRNEGIAQLLLTGVQGKLPSADIPANSKERNANLANLQVQKVGIENLTSKEKEALKQLQQEKEDRGLGGLVGKWNDLRYEKKFPFVIENFSGGKLEGVRQGKRRFSVAHADVPINGTPHDIRRAILLNGSSDSFEVGSDGIVNISYAIPRGDRGIKPDRPITILITIE